MTPFRIPGQIAIARNTGSEGGGAAAPVASATTAPPSNAGSPPNDPAAPPSPAPPAQTAEVNEFEGFGLDDLDEIDLPSDSLSTSGQEASKPPAPAQAQPPAQQQPPAATPQVQQPAASTGQQEQQPPAQPGAQPPSAPAEPEDLVSAIEKNREALVTQLASEQFALSKEEAEAIETDVMSSLPRMQAKVYLKAVQTMHQLIQTQIPALIERHLNAVKARDETAKAFYGKFTGLDQSKHHGDVVQAATLLRQMNPQIKQDDLWAMVASTVAAKYGLQAVAALAAQPHLNGGAPPRPAQQEPFVPARPGAVVRTTPEPDNPWSGMGKEFDDEG